MNIEAPVAPPPSQSHQLSQSTGLPDGVKVGWAREPGGEWMRPEELSDLYGQQDGAQDNAGGSEVLGETINVDDEVDDLKIQDLFAQGFLAKREADGTIVFPDGRESISTERFVKWYDSLDDATRTEVDEFHQAYRERYDSSDRVKAKLEENAPELLQGKLPSDIEGLVDFEYGLGTNQTNADSLEEGVAYLEQRSGVHVGDYDLARRFMLFDGETDPDYASNALIQGYFGSNGGVRFVAVVPKAKEGMSDQYSQSGRGEHMPSDYYAIDSTGQRSVSNKYIAGIVDMEGIFHVNSNFMKDPVNVKQEIEDQSDKIVK